MFEIDNLKNIQENARVTSEMTEKTIEKIINTLAAKKGIFRGDMSTSWISKFRTFITYSIGYECSKLQNFNVLFSCITTA